MYVFTRLAGPDLHTGKVQFRSLYRSLALKLTDQCQTRFCQDIKVPSPTRHSIIIGLGDCLSRIARWYSQLSCHSAFCFSRIQELQECKDIFELDSLSSIVTAPDMTDTATEALPPLGILTIEVEIPRPLGDALNEHTWPFPLISIQVSGSLLDQVVTNDDYPSDFIDRFVKAGQELADQGCIGIFTDCGFLAMAQSALSTRVPVPIATSALIQVPSLLTILPPSRSIGVITYDDKKLGKLHLSKLGIAQIERVHITGAPDTGALRCMIRDGGPYVFNEIKDELIQCTKDLVRKHPEIGAIVLECTQMPPFAEHIQKALDLPVYDLYSMVDWFYSGLVRQTPAKWKDETWTM